MDSDERVERERILQSAVLAGDERAWQSWYDESYEPLSRYVEWRCAGRRDWADEVVQETWLTAVRRVRKFDPRQGPFLAWLRGIAANVLRNHLRRQKTARQRQRPIDGELESAAEASREDQDQTQRIAAALSGLSERHEAVLRAKYLEGFSVAEIAATWGQTPKTIESLLTRARQTFRELYEQLGGLSALAPPSGSQS
jgi:RNA polymerase sigma-70 factor, ECF subfamily